MMSMVNVGLFFTLMIIVELGSCWDYSNNDTAIIKTKKQFGGIFKSNSVTYLRK